MITLKFSSEHLPAIMDTMVNYMDLSENLSITSNFDVDNWLIRLSISQAIYYKLKKLEIKRFHAKKMNMKLEVYEAIVLNRALSIAKTLNAYETAVVEKVKLQLNQKLKSSINNP